MPHNQPCPVCGFLVPDWHWEWHHREDQVKIFQGTAGMECPCCRSTVMHTQAALPLMLPPGRVETVKRNVDRAAEWAHVSELSTLEKYLETPQGQPFAGIWTIADVRAADERVTSNPTNGHE